MPRENNGNKLNMSTLESILRIKSHLVLKNKCCRDFTVTPDMLKLFNSNMYQPSLPSLSTPSTSSNNEELEFDNEIEEQFADIAATSSVFHTDILNASFYLVSYLL